MIFIVRHYTFYGQALMVCIVQHYTVYNGASIDDFYSPALHFL